MSKEATTAERWQSWAQHPEGNGTFLLRAKGELEEMQCTMQLVKLLQDVYEPGMRILDVGCSVGHYLRGIRRLDSRAVYRGVDAYEFDIRKARELFADDANASFEVKDILEPLYTDDPYDIVYCCNVILHLPYFKVPVKNLIESTKRYCFIRTLLAPKGHKTTIVKRVDDNEFDLDGQPRAFTYMNTYNTEFFTDYIRSLGCKVEIIDDEFDPSVLDAEYKTVKGQSGTRIVGGHQVDSNIIFNWKFLKISKQ